VQALVCSVGTAAVRIESDVRELVTVAERALGRGGAGDTIRAVIRVGRVDTAPKHGAHDPGWRIFELRNATFAYDPRSLRYAVETGGQASGIVDCRGESAEWWLVGSLPPRTLLHAFVLDPLSLLLPPHGVLICHGAAIAAHGEATLIFGRSGVGKSTLAFLASHEEPDFGVRHLSDDTVILDFTSDIVEAYPVGSGFGVTPDVLERFALRDSPVMQKSRGKAYLLEVPRRTLGPHPVRRVIFLRKSDAAPAGGDLRKLPQAETLSALLDAQTSIAGPHMISRLAMWRRLATQVSAVEVRYRERCDVDLIKRIAVGRTECVPA